MLKSLTLEPAPGYGSHVSAVPASNGCAASLRQCEWNKGEFRLEGQGSFEVSTVNLGAKSTCLGRASSLCGIASCLKPHFRKMR